MKKTILTIVAVIALTLTSCNKEDIQPNNTPIQDTDGVTLKFVANGPGTSYTYILYTRINDTIERYESYTKNFLTIDSMDYNKHIYIHCANYITMGPVSDLQESFDYNLYKDDIVIDAGQTYSYHPYEFQIN